MVFSEISLYNALKELLGEQKAQTVVEGIKQEVKDEVNGLKDTLASKADIMRLENAAKDDIMRLKEDNMRLERLIMQFEKRMGEHLIWTMATIISVGGLIVAIIKLF